MQLIKKEFRKFSGKSYNSFILGLDIGGTNVNLGVFGIRNTPPELLLSYHFKSRELKELSHAVNYALNDLKKRFNLNITKACIAVAGVISNDNHFAKTTNINWDVDKSELLKKTKLKKIILINDFEAIGYGMNMLNQKDFAVIKKGVKVEKAPMLIIGAGTGLGKTALFFNEESNSYAPLRSEAGHSDFAAQNELELNLVNFIKKQRKTKQSISYEEILSGKGLSNIYLFLRKSGQYKATKYTKEIDKLKYVPEMISKHRKSDSTCKATFKIFKEIYARFARNFALDAMAFGGVYIAGGIAPKNKGIFDKSFMKIFESNYKMSSILKKIPVYLILNNNVGMLGAGFAGSKYL